MPTKNRPENNAGTETGRNLDFIIGYLVSIAAGITAMACLLMYAFKEIQPDPMAQGTNLLWVAVAFVMLFVSAFIARDTENRQRKRDAATQPDDTEGC